MQRPCFLVVFLIDFTAYNEREREKKKQTKKGIVTQLGGRKIFSSHTSSNQIPNNLGLTQ
jgi:hypothetical protein